MESNRDTRATLVDLLDRILDKGLMLNADVIISVSGIPLLGINLKAAIASVETMLRYGIWEDWDKAQRAIATEERRRKVGELPLLEGEEMILKMFGSHWYSNGIYRSWRPGHLYVTDKRVLLQRKEPAEILFEGYYENIEGFALERKRNIAKKETEYLYLFLNSGEVALLHPTEAYPVKEAIEGRMKELGLVLEERAVPWIDDNADKFLKEGEMEEILRSNVAENEEEMETCPSCSAKASVHELLKNGCKVCGWVSARVKNMEVVV
ncbi:MAG: gas vesicle protein [Halobacteriota archaeon]